MRTAVKRYINFQLLLYRSAGLLYKYASEEELEKIVELQKEYITNIFKLN